MEWVGLVWTYERMGEEVQGGAAMSKVQNSDLPMFCTGDIWPDQALGLQRTSQHYGGS